MNSPQIATNKGNKKTELIVALDYPDFKTAKPIFDELREMPILFKVGLELFITEGPDLIEKLVKRGSRIFLDLKFHDIPNTVKSAVASASKLGVEMTSLHLSGGKKMLQAAVSVIPRPLLLGVSVLTSFDEPGWGEVGQAIGGSSKELSQSVVDLAELGESVGISGIVCSPHEIVVLKRRFSGLKLVVPGIRPKKLNFQKGEKNLIDDQARTMTPKQAAQLGADFIVVGRPITQSDNPLKAAQLILEDL